MPQTASEKYLADLCRKSFLSLWSHPNVFTDESRAAKKGDGRELCDLLVVFDDNIIIFSDKHCNFKDTGDASVDWPRWYRRAVTASFRQLYGAESWLRRFPNRLFLDPRCTQRFPIAVTPGPQSRFFRIAVTKGSLEACKAFFGGKSLGSLRISTDPAAGTAAYIPFTAGICEPGKPFVHVFDEYTLDVLFHELDTVADFVAYLDKKERFLLSAAQLVSVDGDEQLLGIYLKKLNDEGEHDIVLPGDTPTGLDGIHIQEGIWEDVSASPQLRSKKAADAQSYAWDRLIEHFIADAKEPPKAFGLEVSDYEASLERALRVMASESRLSRRQLSAALFDVMMRSRFAKVYARVVMSNTFPDASYVYLAIPRPDSESYEEYRKYRMARLYAYCRVAPLHARNARYVVGLGFESHDPQLRGGSEDLIFLDVSKRSPEFEREARDIQQQFGILLDGNVSYTHVHGMEYPETPAEALRMTRAPVGNGARLAPVKAHALREVLRKKKRKERDRKTSKRRNRRKKR